MDIKQKNKDYMREYREKKKESEVVEDVWIKRKQKPLSESTKKQYIKVILRVHQELSYFIHRDMEDNLDYILSGNDLHDQHYKFIKKRMGYVNKKHFIKEMEKRYLNKTSLKVYLIPYTVLMSFLSKEKYFYNKYEFLSKYIINLNKEYEQERDNNTVDEKDKDKIITDYDEESLYRNLDKLGTPLKKVIYGIYTLIPPRRLEYNKMVLSAISEKRNNETNYIILRKKEPIKFIFNDYKTAKSYGEIHVPIPERFRPIIRDYLKKNKKKRGDKFLDLNTNQFIKLIKETFKDVYGVEITVRWLRMGYATYIDSLDLSNNEKQKIAIQMGHNRDQSSKYRKLV